MRTRSQKEQPIWLLILPISLFPIIVWFFGQNYSDQETQQELLLRCIVAGGTAVTLVGIANWPPVNGQTWRYRLVFGLRNGLWFGLCITLYNAPERSWLELFTSAFVGGLAFAGTTMVFLRRTEPRALILDANIKRQLIALCLSWFCLLAMLWAENSISDAGILAISVVLAQPLLIADNRLKTIQNACFFMVMALYVSVKFFGAQVL